MKYLFLFFICLFIFERWSRAYNNPYKTYMLFGKKGSGKTTYIAKKTIQYLKKGYVVYSNVEVPGVILINPNVVGKLSFIPNSVLFLDEVGMIWDKRDFAKFDKDVRDFFKLSRQAKMTVFLFSQAYDDVDKKIRDLTDQLYIIKRFARVFSIARKVVKIQDIGHNMEGSGTIIDDYQYCGLLDCLFFGGMEFTFIPRWVSYFNSFNPKPLVDLKAAPIPMTPTQSRHMYTRLWALDGFSSFLKVVKVKSVMCLDELKKRVTIIFKSHKGSFMRFTSFIRRIPLIRSRSSK